MRNGRTELGKRSDLEMLRLKNMNCDRQSSYQQVEFYPTEFFLVNINTINWMNSFEYTIWPIIALHKPRRTCMDG